MPDFGPWLRANTDTDPALGALKEFADHLGADWPYQSNHIDDYVRVLSKAKPNNEHELKLSLYRYYTAWLPDHMVQSGARVRFGSVALVCSGLVIAAIILFGILNQTFLLSLADAAKARGLVTFLFAVATTSVIIVVTIGVLWVPSTEVEPRFSKAKDILTLLISVLGTILGFYFGQAQTTPKTPETPPVVSADRATEQTASNRQQSSPTLTQKPPSTGASAEPTATSTVKGAAPKMEISPSPSP